VSASPGVFEKFFGVPQNAVKPHVIICPANDAPLFALKKNELSQNCAGRGLFFSVSNSHNHTVISSKNNFMIGDAVLLLGETAAQNVYLFGSCAGAGAALGAKILVEKAYSLESFTAMLDQNHQPGICLPDKLLSDELYGVTDQASTLYAACATVSSPVLERDWVKWFTGNRVSAVDMEASIVFSAANAIGRKAAALLYVTDIIDGKPFFATRDKEEARMILAARKEIAGYLESFIENAKP
jgi:hypothetical protein